MRPKAKAVEYNFLPQNVKSPYVIRGHHPDGFCVVSAVDKLGGIEISLEHRCGSAFWGLLWVNEVLPIQRLLDSSCLRFQLDLVVRALVSATNIIEAQALTFICEFKGLLLTNLLSLPGGQKKRIPPSIVLQLFRQCSLARKSI